MPLDDFSPAGNTALNQQTADVRWIMYMDILGDVQRVTNADLPLSFAGGVDDPLLAGQTFGKISSILQVSSIDHDQGGTGPVTFMLSGLTGVDTDTLNAIGDKSKWQGRRVAAWAAVFALPEDGGAIISVKRIYSGFMQVPRIAGDRSSQTIAMSIDSAGSRLAEAYNSTYLDQPRIDATDISGAATLASAAGLKSIPGLTGTVYPQYPGFPDGFPGYGIYF